MPNINYQKDCGLLLDRLDERQKQIIIKRFGLASEAGEKGQTLEAIGKELGLTRERVRQIINASFKKIEKGGFPVEISRALLSFKQYLRQNGGLKKEDLFFSESIFNHQQNSSNWISFLLVLDKNFCRISESKNLYAFWTIDAKNLIWLQKTIKAAENKLTKAKKVLGLKDLTTAVSKNQKFLNSALEISKKILKSIDNKYGLKSWPEVNPRGVRDLAFLVFKKVKKPLHFIEVASLIDQLILGSLAKPAEFSVISAAAPAAKKTNFQTVHNQLIKSEQFVLIGRGVYALKEWGYAPGTVKEVISNVLKEAKKPLKQEEILKRVLSQRLVKESTILLNLGNKKCFLKEENGRYSLREA